MILSGLNLGQILAAVYGNAWVIAILGLIGADVLSGLAVSFYTKTFHLAEIGNFLLTKAIPYLLGAGSMQVVLLTVPPEWSGLSSEIGTGVWLVVFAAMVGHVLDNIRKLGLPLPPQLGAKPKPEVTATP